MCRQQLFLTFSAFLLPPPSPQHILHRKDTNPTERSTPPPPPLWQVVMPPAAPAIVVTAPSTAPIGVGVVPTPPNNRPRSKAEQPIGELLEDFDSDGEGTYGPGPEQQHHKPGAGEGEQVAGGGRMAVGPSPPRVQVRVCVLSVKCVLLFSLRCRGVERRPAGQVERDRDLS